MMEFLFGYAMGQMLDSGPVHTSSSSTTVRPAASPLGGSDVYVNGPALSRVVDPLDIRLGSSGYMDFWDNDNKRPLYEGLSYKGMFTHIVGNPDDFVVLRVTRILKPDETAARVWFDFIAKDKLRPVKP